MVIIGNVGLDEGALCIDLGRSNNFPPLVHSATNTSDQQHKSTKEKKHWFTNYVINICLLSLHELK